MGAALPSIVWVSSCVVVYTPLWDTHAASLQVKTAKGNKRHIHGTGTQTPPGFQTAPGYAAAVGRRNPLLSIQHYDQVLLDILHEEGLRLNIKRIYLALY